MVKQIGPQDTEIPRLCTPKATAKMLGDIAIGTLANWRTRGGHSTLPWVRVGGRVMYRLEDINAWIEKNVKNNGGAA